MILKEKMSVFFLLWCFMNSGKETWYLFPIFPDFSRYLFCICNSGGCIVFCIFHFFFWPSRTSNYVCIYSRRFATATARTASFSSTAIVLFYCRRSATRTPVRPPRFERCCSHTFATARNCQWCRPLRPKTSESFFTDCREKKTRRIW